MAKLRLTSQEGWAVHIYDCDRHLLVTLGPSHGWMLLLGAVLGFAIAAVGYRNPAPAPAVPPTVPSAAPLQID